MLFQSAFFELYVHTQTHQSYLSAEVSLTVSRNQNSHLEKSAKSETAIGFGLTDETVRNSADDLSEPEIKEEPVR